MTRYQAVKTLFLCFFNFQAGNVPSQFAAGQTPLQPTNTATQAMVAIPVFSCNALQ